MKKILYMCDFFSCLGGTEYYNYILISSLIQQKFSLWVLIGEKPINDFWIKKLISIGVKVTFPEEKCKDIVSRDIERQYIERLEKKLLEWEPEVIYTNPAGKMIVTWLENFKFNNIPIVATEWTTPSVNTEHWYPKELRNYINKISAYISTCHKSTVGLREYLGYKGDIYEIPHIIQKVQNIPDSSHYMEDINAIGCICRLSAEKGLVYLLGAWKYLSTLNIKATLHIYGEGNEKAHLLELVNALGIKDTVFWEGTFEPFCGIDDICRKHMVFVQPSLFESIPTTVIELMARKRVVISSNVGGISEIISPEYNAGLLVEPASTDALINAIKYIWDNPHIINKLSNNARKIYEEKYDLEKNVREIIKILLTYSRKE